MELIKVMMVDLQKLYLQKFYRFLIKVSKWQV